MSKMFSYLKNDSMHCYLTVEFILILMQHLKIKIMPGKPKFH